MTCGGGGSTLRFLDASCAWSARSAEDEAADAAPVDGDSVTENCGWCEDLGAASEPAAENNLPGVLLGAAFQGAGWLCQVALAGGAVLRVLVPADQPLPGEGVPVLLHWPAEALVVLAG